VHHYLIEPDRARCAMHGRELGEIRARAHYM
jgi:hypothetical protein